MRREVGQDIFLNGYLDSSEVFLNRRSHASPTKRRSPYSTAQRYAPLSLLKCVDDSLILKKKRNDSFGRYGVRVHRLKSVTQVEPYSRRSNWSESILEYSSEPYNSKGKFSEPITVNGPSR